jgi:hypothetical protein
MLLRVVAITDGAESIYTVQRISVVIWLTVIVESLWCWLVVQDSQFTVTPYDVATITGLDYISRLTHGFSS